MCENCIRDVCKAFTFKQQFIQASKILEQRLTPNHSVKIGQQFEKVLVKYEPTDDNVIVGETMNTECQPITVKSPKDDHPSSSSEQVTPIIQDESLKEKHTKHFKCDICTKVLSNQRTLKVHLRTHSDERPFECTDCVERFKTRKAFVSHKTIHEKNNPIKCDICEKTFRQKQILKNHISVVHERNRPFLCGLCGKSYAERSTFKVNNI